ncbi:Trypanosoma vivax [Trypanosoma conorhini]|uniref:Trypanosoma vivax n=1 Tax=Trypanosoma conorhini TaxID=83891 RepID=A0A422Q7G4_9TRYP|nr:Trypanosoma vivax [Trypanosoma conorhini]RNF25898.1 Trypanosoma vivax [Trypanosoma conorhini]
MLEGDVGDVSAAATEVNVARLLAAAANCREGLAVATIRLRLLHNSTESHAGWSRREKDVLLLCLDRAVSRVYPPLDPLQYTQAPPEFLLEDGARVVRLRLTPSARYSSAATVPHRVEGKCPPPRTTPADATSSDDAPVVDAAAARGECGGDEDAAALMRRRWRKAAWMTARIFNEGGWYPAEQRPVKVPTETVGCMRSGASSETVLDVAARLKERRLLHADAFGMEFIGLIVALTPRYAYVAVPFLQDGQALPQWSLVSRVGVPSLLAEAAATLTRKRERSECATGGFVLFLNEEELVAHDVGPLNRLQPDQCVRVVLRAHKVYCKQQRTLLGGPASLSLAFEDAAVLSCTAVEDQTNLLESLSTYLDLLQIVRASCARFLRGYSKYMGTSANSAEARLFTAVTDTVSVHMKKLRGREGRSPVTVASPQEIPSLLEGTCVEFKAKIDKWRRDGPDDAAPGQRRHAIVNLERIRHTVAAMASTLGGVLLVGVADDGEVIGHARGALKELRLSGFCPAMVKGSVTVTEMRAVRGERPTTMPKDWWKAAKPQPREQQDSEDAADRVVTVVTVRRGPAPFYTTSRYSVPYTRGFASTVPLHLVVCARRIADLLP